MFAELTYLLDREQSDTWKAIHELTVESLTRAGFDLDRLHTLANQRKTEVLEIAAVHLAEADKQFGSGGNIYGVAADGGKQLLPGWLWHGVGDHALTAVASSQLSVATIPHCGT